ncbi:sulfotransferase family 2 domain-containing protein [Marinobacterium lacunae]|uniref:sulfotransferase family 2 domain-containing protein n=1 Tax=Marinobacterium lacunae TaxID=1232683 RepID=UPI00068EB6FA|nr:sulfotransferase family 2 domain-containing protein [Marinobacterium lacunae]
MWAKKKIEDFLYYKKRVKNYQINQERLKLNRYSQYLDNGFIFIHIPKAAGSSVNMKLYGNLGLGHASINHYIDVFGKPAVDALYKFTFVRNPNARVESAYNFLKNGGMNSTDDIFAQKKISLFEDVNDFVVNGLAKDFSIQKWIHFIPQYRFLEYKGCLHVDFIGRFENIDKDFKYISMNLGLKGDLPELNKQIPSDSKLNPEAKNILRKIYHKDFEYFWY